MFFRCRIDNIPKERRRIMFALKRSVAGISILVFLFAASACFAESAIPNLLGTWTTKSKAILMLKDKSPGKWTHWEKQVTDVNAETVFTAERLSATYGIALRVVACSSQRVVLA